MTRKRNFLCTGLCTAALLLAGTAGALAAQKDQSPSIGGQNNRCWGEIASGLAQYESTTMGQTAVDEKGGAMGLHSRSLTAAENNGGFASNGVFTIPQPRDGVGNVSSGFPHNTPPGDGGNGQHAVNNGEFLATIADPATGVFFSPTNPGTAITCSLDVNPNFGVP